MDCKLRVDDWWCGNQGNLFGSVLPNWPNGQYFTSPIVDIHCVIENGEQFLIAISRNKTRYLLGQPHKNPVYVPPKGKFAWYDAAMNPPPGVEVKWANANPCGEIKIANPPFGMGHKDLMDKLKLAIGDLYANPVQPQVVAVQKPEWEYDKETFFQKCPTKIRATLNGWSVYIDDGVTIETDNAAFKDYIGPVHTSPIVRAFPIHVDEKGAVVVQTKNGSFYILGTPAEGVLEAFILNPKKAVPKIFERLLPILLAGKQERPKGEQLLLL